MHVPTVWRLQEPGSCRSTRHIIHARTTSVQRRMLGIYVDLGREGRKARVERTCRRARLREAVPDNSAPRAVAPCSDVLLGRTRARRILPAKSYVRTTPDSLSTHAGTTGFLPASPHQSAVHAAYWGHLPPRHPCHRAHDQGRDTRDKANTRLASKELRGSWITSVGEAGHSGPTGLHRGPGLVLEHLFHFRIDGTGIRLSRRKLNASSFGFLCLWSMRGTPREPPASAVAVRPRIGEELLAAP